MIRLNSDTGDRTVYTMSLDTLDMTLLQQIYSRKITSQQAEESEIWSFNNLYKRSEKEYYEFEIWTDNSSSDDAKDTAKEKFNLKNYIQMINEYKKSDLFTFKVNEKRGQKRIVIHTASGDVVSVPAGHFHGLSAAGAHCKLCRALVADVTSHLHDIRHVAAVTALVRDKHCIRQINKTINHCILCNDIIENPEVHILCNLQHERNLFNALVNNSANIEKSLNNDPKSNPDMDDEVPDSNINKKKSNKVLDMNTKIDEPNKVPNLKTNKNVPNKVPDLNINNNDSHKIPKSKIVKQDEHKTDVEQSGGCHYCKVCDVMLTNNAKNIKSHETGLKHRQKLKDCPTNNSSAVPWPHKTDVKQSGVWHYCKVCDVMLTNNAKHINAHESGLKHKQKLKDCPKNNSSSAASPGQYLQPETSKSDPSNSGLLSQNKNQITTYANKVKHTELSDKGTKTSIQKPKVIVEDNVNMSNIHFCKICNVEVPNNANNIREHKLGSNHKNNVNNNNQKDILNNIAISQKSVTLRTNLKLENDLRQPPVSVKNVTSPSSNECIASTQNDNKNMLPILKESREKSEIQTTDSASDSHYCSICKVSVPNKENNIIEHESGSIHTKKLNAIKKIDVVKQDTPTLSNIQNSQSHPQTITKTATAAKVSLDRSLPNLESSTLNSANLVKSDNLTIESNRLVPNCPPKKSRKRFGRFDFANLLKSCMTETEDDNYILCKICHDLVRKEFNDVMAHGNGSKHLKKFDEILIANKIKKDGVNYICEYCNDNSIRMRHLYEHITSFSHLLNNIQTVRGEIYNLEPTSNINKNNDCDVSADKKTEAIVTYEDKTSNRVENDNFKPTSNINKNNDWEISSDKKTEAIVIYEDKTSNRVKSENLKPTSNINKNNDCEVSGDKETKAVVTYEDKMSNIATIRPNGITYEQKQQMICSLCGGLLPSNNQGTRDHSRCISKFESVAFGVGEWYRQGPKKSFKCTCKHCRNLIYMSKENIDNHYTGNCLEDVAIDNKLDMIESETFCRVCGLYFSKIHTIEHVISSSHKYNFAISKTHCQFCSVIVQNSHLNTHNESETHKVNVKIVMQYYNQVSGTDQKCRLCKINVPNNSINLVKHLSSTAHIQSNYIFTSDLDYTFTGRKVTCNTCNVDITEIYLDHSKSLFHLELHHKLKNYFWNMTKTGTCSVCDEVIPFFSDNLILIRRHLNSILHLKMFNLIMTANKIEDRNGTLKCTYCKVIVDKFDTLSHIEDDEHKYNVRMLPRTLPRIGIFIFLSIVSPNFLVAIGLYFCGEITYRVLV